MNTVSVSLSDLNKTVKAALDKLGLASCERDIVQRVLMYAELRGSTQGLVKIKERTILADKHCTQIKVDKKSLSIATINGGGHTGMYVLSTAAAVAADLVKASGIALVSTHNTRSSTGAISYYANELATQGYIAIVLAGSPKVTAIEGGTEPVFGTNPVAIAVPTAHDPLVFDMATSAMTWFAVINARDNNQTLPEDIAYDQQGLPTTDPVAAMQGALRTFAGAKGSGLALMFEILTGVLGNGSITGDEQDNRSNTVIAIDPSVIDSGFTNRASALIERLQATRLRPQQKSLRLPGEHSTNRANRCLAENKIEINSAVYQHLVELAGS